MVRECVDGKDEWFTGSERVETIGGELGCDGNYSSQRGQFNGGQI